MCVAHMCVFLQGSEAVLMLCKGDDLEIIEVHSEQKDFLTKYGNLKC